MTVRDDHDGDVDPLDIEAIDWVVRLTVGSISDADHAAFVRWRQESPAHERAFVAASDLCGHLRRIPLDVTAANPATPAEASDISANVIPFPRAPAISRRTFLGGGAVAASLAGALAMTNPPLGLWPSLAEMMADERTRVGERRRFSPIAGVAVELNSRSSASRSDRGLDLVDGEAFVTVSRVRHPFEVSTGGASIGASQAAFNVQSFDDRLCVTCVRGTVLVKRDDRGVTLAAGRELVIAAGKSVEAAAEPNVRLAWRQGLLILRHTPVAEALPQINRYYPGRLVLSDKSKSNWPVSGVFHIEQIELAIVQLQRLLNVRPTRLPGGVVLLG